MEFAFNCEKVIGCDAEGFAIIDGKKGIQHMLNSNQAIRIGGTKGIQDAQNQIYEIIDRIGAASSKAQGLPAIITSGSRLFTSDTRLYLRCEGNRTLALLKVGVRKLFIRNEMGSIKEISPLCVLDFYVHESVQRSGQGKQIFEKMLQSEEVKPEKLGYDRPSEKLLAFLAKHYSLKRYVPQNNNYVVYNQYFESGNASEPQIRNSYNGAMEFKNLTTSRQQPTMNNPYQIADNDFKNKSPAFGGMTSTSYPNAQLPSMGESKSFDQRSTGSSRVYGTTQNFNQQQQRHPYQMEQMTISSRQQLPPKPQSKQSTQDIQSSLSSAGGFQVFGNANPQQSYSKRQSPMISTSDRIFGGSTVYDDKNQKENNYQRGSGRLQGDQQQNSSRHNPETIQQPHSYYNQFKQQNQNQKKEENVGSLLIDMQRMNLIAAEQQTPKVYQSAADYKINKMNNKMDEIESKIKQNEMQVEFLKKKTNEPGQTTHGMVSAPYAQKLPQPDNRTSNPLAQTVVQNQGPTSFTAAGGFYNKKTQYAIVNENVAARNQDNHQFAQLQKSMGTSGNNIWGSYNYAQTSVQQGNNRR